MGLAWFAELTGIHGFVVMELIQDAQNKQALVGSYLSRPGAQPPVAKVLI
ncbi:hypothetical protein RIF25_02150 [Thermosynechococcaceae cyanobacterium BACA0444]|uniref:Uncharacterized protein n=1 Tax=Pseudocalidococcus azoricus BACA0444 TaxID=2918990 RepID=A0AAE4JV22_9CYAN|nr:hypothetical protein [Pseudocalidococcus azoricus]MDS3859601.1 hypothetical protein [Pseudocalidococcus azoricus BACA0444]